VNPLARIQEDFQAFMLHREAAIERHVIGTTRVPIATRLAIYGDGYCSRLIEALQANYPALAQLLGPEDFGVLGTAYVRAHQSSFRSVRYYGCELPEFLGTHPEYAQVPVLAELARWEWAMTEAFDAADATPVGVSALAIVAPEQWAELRFEFHPSLRRLSLFWNVPSMWKALTGEDEERLPPSVQLEPTEWLLWREDLQTYFRSLQTVESAALDAARRGAAFGEICVGLSEHLSEEETPARAAGYLRRWIESGLICSLR
jgi:hypothetical protein